MAKLRINYEVSLEILMLYVVRHNWIVGLYR